MHSLPSFLTFRYPHSGPSPAQRKLPALISRIVDWQASPVLYLGVKNVNRSYAIEFVPLWPRWYDFNLL